LRCAGTPHWILAAPTRSLSGRPEAAGAAPEP